MDDLPKQHTDSKDEVVELLLPIAHTEPRKASSRAVTLTLGALKLLACCFVLQQLSIVLLRQCTFWPPRPEQTGVDWKSCGDGFEGFQCANISVPLDYHDLSDGRTMSIAVTRLLATDKENRKGAIFLNPGGPGGSGTAMAYSRGPRFSKILKGQYDIIGFDPRGINLTRPYVSCFESQFDADVFAMSINNYNLNLPVNVSSPDVHRDLENQITKLEAATAAVAKKCGERTGEAIGYMGTEAVVRDIDYMSKLIEGEDKRINFWGFSYGTVLGQYLIKILPPERIGRVIIDGVVNPTVWSDYPTMAFDEGLDNIDDVLASFVSSCIKAGSNCTLASAFPSYTAQDLLAQLDSTIDSLYASPRPIFDLPSPAVASASNLRALLFRSMYQIRLWPDLAEHLANGFIGNFTGIVNATMSKVDKEGIGKPDSSVLSTYPIFCADTKPYDAKRPPPSVSELADLTLYTLKKYSYRMGDNFFKLSLCHHWDAVGVMPRRTRYAGKFDMADDTLDTPILVLSNTYDPVTSLASAMYANRRLKNNARLVQQTDGWGHCTISQVSYCTAGIVQAFFLNGTVPDAKHTRCAVDQLPWVPFEDKYAVEDNMELDKDARELRKAWREVVEDWDLELV